MVHTPEWNINQMILKGYNMTYNNSRYKVLDALFKNVYRKHIKTHVNGYTRCGLALDIIYTNDHILKVSVCKKESHAHKHLHPNYQKVIKCYGVPTMRFIKENTSDFIEWR